jgi:hypothetical protein
MCFQHILLNALDLFEEGIEVKVIFEGAMMPPINETQKTKRTEYNGKHE